MSSDVQRMKALSVRAPWWWWIATGWKPVENRSWPTKYRGRVLIHASKWWRGGTVARDRNRAAEFVFWQHRDLVDKDLPLPEPGVAGWDHVGEVCEADDMKKLGGKIVAVADLVDCVERHDSPWFTGPYGFVLENVLPVEEPWRVHGRLGLFDVVVPKDVQLPVKREAAA